MEYTKFARNLGHVMNNVHVFESQNCVTLSYLFLRDRALDSNAFKNGDKFLYFRSYV